MTRRFLITIVFFLAIVFPFGSPAFAAPVDLVLVLDNSGSMLQNDPEFLTQRAVTSFLDQLPPETRVAMIIFDQDVRLVVPLSDLDYDTRQSVQTNLEAIDYRGMYTDSPAAIERAIYELKTGGRTDVEKAIIFMTDGIVDTGDASRDRDKLQWLKDDLTQYAVQSGIAIFGIAFTENADFQLIQRLALRTNGEYFRAQTPEDIESVFFRVRESLDQRHRQKIEMEVKAAEEAEKARKKAASPPPPPVPQPSPTPKPVVKAPPPPPPEAGVPWSFVALAAVFVFGIVAVLFLVMGRKGASKKPPQVVVSPPVETEDYIPEAILTDVHGVTKQDRYEISRAVTKIGKIAAREGNVLNHIVIEKNTVSRRHADIEYRDGDFWVEDQGSMNGTFVNNNRLTKAHRLKSGDLLKFDAFEFEFALIEPDPEGEEKTMMAADVFKPASPVASTPSVVPPAPAPAAAPAEPVISAPTPAPAEPVVSVTPPPPKELDPVKTPEASPANHPKPWILPDPDFVESMSAEIEKREPVPPDMEKTLVDDDADDADDADNAKTLID